MKSLKSEVRQLINKLSERFDQLPEGSLHPLDADLILSLLRQLYEKTEALRNTAPWDIETESDDGQLSPDVPLKSVPEEKKNEEIPHIPSPLIHVEEKSAQQPFKSESIEVEIPPAGKTVVQESQPLVVSEFNSESEFVRDPGPEIIKPVSVPVDLFGTPTIADKLKSDAPSLNDKITTGRSDLSLADHMQLKPIGDIKAAIGLNDKFQFINELFEGSSDRYAEAVSLLNSCSGSLEAEQLFADLKLRYNWNEQHQGWKKLQEFVIRRYM